MDKHYPFIYIYGSSSSTTENSDGCKVHVAFGREKRENDRNDDPDWICAFVSLRPVSRSSLLTSQCNVNNFSTRARCFRCQVHRSGQSRNALGAVQALTVLESEVKNNKKII